MAWSCRDSGIRGWAAGWLCGLGLLLAPAWSAVRAADIETRDFNVLVGGKAVGEVHMTIHRQDNGQIQMRCDTDVKVNAVVRTYKYSYRGEEIWKDNRLVRFASSTDDNGKRYVITASTEGNALRLRVNTLERLIRPDVWLTSYWCLPDAKLRNNVVPIIDADNGRDLDSRLQFVAAEQRSIAGQVVNVHHWRLAGKANVDLWYDGSERLVRQEWVEQGHRTVLDLVRVRR
jgi:hypothetical protein